jgi:A/G-specific adenine glycosylase
VCIARAQGRQDELPVKDAKKKRPHHHVSVGLIMRADGRFLVQRRPSRALLGGLWELPGGKRHEGETDAEACARELREELRIDVCVGERVAQTDHAYSHFTVTLTALACSVTRGEPATELETRWITLEERHELAFPKANHKLFAQIEARSTSPALFG